MIKKMWISPRISFVNYKPNEYISSCSPTRTITFECNAYGDKISGLYSDYGYGWLGALFSAPYASNDTLLSYYASCNETHYIHTSDTQTDLEDMDCFFKAYFSPATDKNGDGKEDIDSFSGQFVIDGSQFTEVWVWQDGFASDGSPNYHATRNPIETWQDSAKS